MEINPAGVLIFFLIVFAIAVIASMAFLAILHACKIVRFKYTGSFIAWSLGVGLAAMIIFISIKCNEGNSKTIAPVHDPADTLSKPAPSDTTN